MKTIVITTQKEMDNLPDSFTEFTYIEIRSSSSVVIEVKKAYGSSQVTAYGSSQVTAYGSSQVTAYGSSQVTAYGSSQVTAYDSSQVTACDSSQVTACGSSRVTACGSSQVTACDSSRVTACGSSQVTAYDSSQVTACDSSRVTACGSSQVTAYDSSRVTACGNSIIAVLSALVIILKIKQWAIIALEGVKIKLPEKDATATVIEREIAIHNIESFIDYYNLKVENNEVVLFKSVNPVTLCDFQTGKVKYQGLVECPDFDPSTERECGGGLHLCPTPELTQTFNVGKILKCKVSLNDIVVYGKNIKKVRCRKVEVLGEYDGK